MKEKVIEVKDYLSISKLPSVDYVINPYVGCIHACRYCYACFMKKFTNHDEEWGTFIDVKKCDKEINLNKIKGKKVFLSSVTDCYNPLEEKYEVTRSILKQLVNAECEISITTKSKLILRDLDLLKQMKNLTVSLSINTLDESFKNDMDKASSIKDRLNTLKVLHENGIRCALFMSPMFPFITDFKAIIEVSKDFVDEYWFENLNLRADYKRPILNYIRNRYPDYFELYRDIYIKGDITYWDKLMMEIKKYCKENNISYKNYFHHGRIN